MRAASIIVLAITWSSALFGGEVTVVLPDGQTATSEVEAGRPVQVQTKDGLRLIGVDMSWYVPIAPAAEKPGELSEEDRREIQGICTVPSFYDRCEILLLLGDADRAVALLQLIRDRDFHAGKGEVIWRAELWYFEFQDGGWAKVSQQSKVLDRQRFASRGQYLEYVRPIRFVPKLGRAQTGNADARIELSADDMKQAARPGEK